LIGRKGFLSAGLIPPPEALLAFNGEYLEALLEEFAEDGGSMSQVI
jgi:hypothetical protein